MGERQILAHSRKTGVIYFQNAAPKILNKNYNNISMKYYLKNSPKGYMFERNNSHSTEN